MSGPPLRPRRVRLPGWNVHATFGFNARRIRPPVRLGIAIAARHPGREALQASPPVIPGGFCKQVVVHQRKQTPERLIFHARDPRLSTAAHVKERFIQMQNIGV